MGIFDFLKRKKEIKEIDKEETEKKSRIVVKLEDLDRWIEENLEEKNKRIEFFIEEVYKELDRIIIRAKKDLKELREFEIRKAEERVLIIVKQQREVYVKLVEEFLDDILKSKDKNIVNFVKYYIERSIRFSKQSLKPFHITSELIGKPLERIILDFKEIDRCIKRFDDLIKNELSKIDALKKLIENTKKKEQLKKEYLKNLEDISADINKFNEEIKKLREKDENITTNKEYIEKERLKEEINKLDSEVKSKKESIIFVFNKIKKGLKRFEWTEQNKPKKELLNRLIEETAETLMTQKTEKIYDLLDELAEKINKKEINENILKEINEVKNSLKIVDEIRKFELKLNELKEKEGGIRISFNWDKIKVLEEEIKKSNKIRESCEIKIKEIGFEIINFREKIIDMVRNIFEKEINKA